MTDAKVAVAKLFQNGGSQAVRLPAEFRFEGDQVFIARDSVTGDVTLSSLPRNSGRYWRDLFAALDKTQKLEEEDDVFMSERPMNVQIEDRDLYGEDR